MGSRNDNLVINPDEMNSAVSSYNQLASRVGEAKGSVSSGFTGMRDAGFFSNGLKEISKQLGAISKTLGNVGKSISNQTSGMLELDAALAQKASEIEIPQDFVANNSMALNEYNKSLLEKLDGKSVNEGKDTTDKPEEVGESVMGGMLELTDITKAPLEQQELKDNLEGNKQGLDNINKAGGTDMQNVDDSKSFAKEQLTNINNGGGTAKQEVDSSTVVNKEELVNINTNSTLQKQELNDAINTSKQVLTDMNGGTPSVNSAVANDVLNNVKNNSTSTAKEKLGDALSALNGTSNSSSNDVKSMSSGAVNDAFKGI